MKIPVILATVASILHQSHQQCLTPNDNQLSNPKGKMGLYPGQQAFSLNLLQAINQLTPTENLFFSPYSTYHALLLAYFISANQTEGYLKKVLQLDGFPSKSDVYSAYKFNKYATEVRTQNKAYEFTNANRIYVSDQVNVRECVNQAFGEELRKTDFVNNPEAARTDINTWVENRTHTMIKDLLPPGSIDKETDLVLVNAAYFKGIWENKFDPAQTAQEVFYITPSKQTIVDMMHVEGTFNHEVSESLMAHILELPYQGEDISMFILLPPFTKEDGVETVLKRLTPEKFKSIVSGASLSARTVEVSLPKFSLEHSIELVPILQSMGIGDFFKDGADLSVLSGHADVSINQAIHKVKIEVDEVGSKAAGVTTGFSWRLMSSGYDVPVSFKCTRPFVFFLYNKVVNAVLEKLGVGDLFKNNADLSLLSDTQNVSLGNALHKAKIEVTEEGTKAAAATVLFSFRSSRPAEPAQFICNHPFIYLIYDKTDQSVLFTGIFRRPF